MQDKHSDCTKQTVVTNNWWSVRKSSKLQLVTGVTYVCCWQVIAALKTDKDELESHLYDIQQVQSQLETKKEQLEMERQELILKKEHLSGRLLCLVACASCIVTQGSVVVKSHVLLCDDWVGQWVSWRVTSDWAIDWLNEWDRMRWLDALIECLIQWLID